jgi:hypothetical protein
MSNYTYFTVYVITVGAQFQLFKGISANFALESVINTVKLIISCLIHVLFLVYDETDSLYLNFDELDISCKNLDTNGYKEALYFKSQTIDSKFGFTVVGTIPFKRTTLLSVLFWRKFLNKELFD